MSRTHVLAGEADQPASHVERILAALQHAAQPVEGRVLVGAPHGLVQRRDAVVMLFTFE